MILSYRKIDKKKRKNGPDRGLNPEPLAPKARIIPLDHQAFSFLFDLNKSYFVLKFKK